MVLGHHSSLAYTTFAPFDKQHMFGSTAPVVDVTRWVFFDYAENFNDVFFMSLMFFVSGLFVYPALRRHGTFGFMRDRLLRLGLPFAFAVVFLMPIAYYASWQLTGRSTGFVDFYRLLAERSVASLREHALATFAIVLFLTALVYLPLLSRYGFGAWTDFLTSPFSFQISRIGLYALWFVFGFLIGAPGIAKGLLACEGSLARHWRLWIWG